MFDVKNTHIIKYNWTVNSCQDKSILRKLVYVYCLKLKLRNGGIYNGGKTAAIHQLAVTKICMLCCTPLFQIRGITFKKSKLQSKLWAICYVFKFSSYLLTFDLHYKELFLYDHCFKLRCHNNTRRHVCRRLLFCVKTKYRWKICNYNWIVCN